MLVENYVIGPSEANWEALNEPLSVDPITFEIIRYKLEAVNEEQAIALKEVSVSPIVAGAGDFNNALFTADGRLASMGPQVVFHSGAMPIILKHIMSDFSSEDINDGDMFIVNDPFKGAVHHPDVTIMAPIFFRGKLVSWAGVTAHQVDMGGMSVGSVSVRAKEKQQEGLMMPPLKIVSKGQLRQDVWRLILNNTRQPQMVGMDLRGFIASNVVARDRLTEMLEEYSEEIVLTVMEELIRYSERRMRERIKELPDGEFSTDGFLDHDGTENKVYRTSVKIIKSKDKLTIDMSESSPQASGYINCTEGCLVGAVFGGIAPLLARGIPWNQGVLQSIEVIAPKGLICNAEPPAATGAATIGQGWVITLSTAHALSKLLALVDQARPFSQAVTHGTMAALFTGDVNQHGEAFGNQLIDAQIGGGGASAVSDGIDQSGCFVSPRPHVPNIETNEADGPMLFLYRCFFPDSGGDGSYRGGRAAGTAWIPHGVEKLRCSLTSHGVEVPISYGQFGGMPGVCSKAMVVQNSDIREIWSQGKLPLVLEEISNPIDLTKIGGDVRILEAKEDEFPLCQNDMVQYTFQGGGGYGDPLTRSVESVLNDIDLEFITEEKAQRTYGVVTGESGTETESRRKKMRLTRLDHSHKPQRHSVDPESGSTPLTRFGSGLVIARGTASGRLNIECECGYVFCSASDNWKSHAASHVLNRAEIPKTIIVHEQLELVAHLCPECGVQHSLDVKEIGQPVKQDIKILEWT